MCNDGEDTWYYWEEPRKLPYPGCQEHNNQNSCLSPESNYSCGRRMQTWVASYLRAPNLKTNGAANIRLWSVGDRWISTEHWWNKTDRESRTQMKFYKVVARPTLLYVSGTRVTTTRDMTRLEAAEMRFLISVRGLHKTRQNKKRSHKKTRTRDLWNTRREIQTQNWTNHLERKDNTRLAKHALNCKPRGRRDLWTP